MNNKITLVVTLLLFGFGLGWLGSLIHNTETSSMHPDSATQTQQASVDHLAITIEHATTLLDNMKNEEVMTPDVATVYLLGRHKQVVEAEKRAGRTSIDSIKIRSRLLTRAADLAAAELWEHAE